MKHSISLIAATVVLVGVAGVATEASATGSSQRTIRLSVHEASFHYSDVGRQGISPGDSFQITDTLWQSGKKVGVDAFTCTQVTAAENICTAVLTLSGRGEIDLQGLSQNATEGDVYTVLGGTRQFLRAAGTASSSGDSSTAKGGSLVLQLAG
jgi:hypothetical protein